MRPGGVALALVAAGLVTGCMTLEQMAPPVGPNLVLLGESRGHTADDLAAGRAIYLNQCATCHATQPVGHYSHAQWQKILPRMAKQAKLDARESEQVQAYVLTALSAE
jgi:cytochrome c5